MNYLKEILAFHSLLEINQLDSTDQALWYHLMHINNKCGWAEWFTVANMSLQARLGGVDKKTIDRHRNNLINAGLIEYKNQGKKQAGKYRIISLVERIGGDIGGNIPPETSLSVSYLSPNTPPLNKDKDKQKDNNNPSVVSPDISEAEREILNRLQAILGWPFDYAKDLDYVRQLLINYPTLNLIDQISDYSTWLLDHPLTKKSNPRLQLRNWCKNSVKWAEKKKPTVINGGKNKQREEELDFGWHREKS